MRERGFSTSVPLYLCTHKTNHVVYIIVIKPPIYPIKNLLNITDIYIIMHVDIVLYTWLSYFMYRDSLHQSLHLVLALISGVTAYLPDCDGNQVEGW